MSLSADEREIRGKEILNNLHKKLCNMFGEEAARSVICNFVSILGGRRVLFPNKNNLNRMIRNNQIFSLYNEEGIEPGDLADRFGLSKKQVLNILKINK
jgi:Mor family transcriptional regulator